MGCLAHIVNQNNKAADSNKSLTKQRQAGKMKSSYTTQATGFVLSTH